VRDRSLRRIQLTSCLILVMLAARAAEKAGRAAGAGMQGLPVQTATVVLAPVAQSSEYVATIKSRRSASVLPQVSDCSRRFCALGRSREGRSDLMVIDPLSSSHC